MGECTSNTDSVCNQDYDEVDACYMEARYTRAVEGFCYDGDCRGKRKIGVACKNSGGNYDNNYCVTHHCDDDYGVCRAFNAAHGPINGIAHCDQYIVTLGLNPTHTLFACEGDCDSDIDCSNKYGDSVCFHRNYASDPQPPGCLGTVFSNWDYCVYETDLDAAYPGGWDAISHEPDAPEPALKVFPDDPMFEVKVVFPGPEYALALLAIFALVCFVWTVLVRRCRFKVGKPQFQVLNQCEDSQEENNCL